MGVQSWPADAYAVEPTNAACAVRFNIGPLPNQAAFAKSVRKLAGLLKEKNR